MHSFESTYDSCTWESVAQRLETIGEVEVRRALSARRRNLNDFLALISPAAEPFLEEMAQESNRLTRKRFGNTVGMYAPMYLSNECQNICTYCGFSMNVEIPRKTLTDEEIHGECRILKSRGYDHVLVVTGEANKTVGIEYFLHAVGILKQYFTQISFEVQPMKEDEYQALHDAGVYSVLVYQETYREETYKTHHPKGRKSNFRWRMDTPDRIGRTGMHKMGLGVLIGLEDWRVDSFFNALHVDYLKKTYWQTKYAVSFPRLRPCANGIELGSVMTDRQLAQLICAYRLWDQDLELSLSTREAASFRDNSPFLGITSISAASATEPGGYAEPKEALEQFEIDDARPVPEFVKRLQEKGIEPVFKDWDASFMV